MTKSTRTALFVTGFAALAAGVVLTGQAFSSVPDSAGNTGGTAVVTPAGESPVAVKMTNWTETDGPGKKGGRGSNTKP